MARKPTATGEIKALISAHNGYKAYKWQCTGRHRHQISLLSIAVPLECPEGHPLKILREIPMTQYLKKDIQRIKEQYGKEQYQFELRA